MERPASIRELVQAEFHRLGVTDQAITETLLIRDGHYCGHRYATSDLTAIWFLEERQLKIYNSAGRTIYVVSTDADVVNRKVA